MGEHVSAVMAAVLSGSMCPYLLSEPKITFNLKQQRWQKSYNSVIEETKPVVCKNANWRMKPLQDLTLGGSHVAFSD